MEDPKFGHNKEQSFIEFSTTEGKFRLGKEDGKIFLEINEVKTYLTEDDGTLNTDAAELGANPTPVVRTVGAIVGTNKPNVNIDALDAAIGANVSPYVRTLGTIATNLAVNQNITNLDTAIGADAHLTPLTRTTGQLALGTTLYAMLELIDSVIGADNQMPDSSKIVTRNYSIYQNLRALDTYKSVETITRRIGGAGRKAMGTITISGTPVAEQTITIGGTQYTFKALRALAGQITLNADNDVQVTNIVNAVTADQVDIIASDGAGATVALIAATPGVAGNALPLVTNATGVAVNGGGFMGGTTLGIDRPSADFNFAIADDQVEQIFDLGEVLPSLARIIDCFARTTSEFSNAVSLVAEIGSSSSGHEVINSGTIMAADAILAMAADHNMTILPKVAAGHIYVAITPGANWSLITGGRVSIYLTYINPTNIT
jgi:hypothetical protein